MMKNRQLIVSVILLCLIVGVYFVLKRDKVTTLDKDEAAFAVENTDRISAIYMRSRAQNTDVVLEKNKEGKWMVNGTYPADMAKLNLLLTTIKDVGVKYPVSKDYWNMVIKNLSSDGVKVEIYDGRKKIKTYYVGSPTPDNMGTYYWMEDAPRPYVMHIDGFQGYLTPRFFVSEKDWRSKIIFDHNPDDIEYVKVDWTDDPSASFIIRQQGAEVVLESQGLKGSSNQNKLRSYLSHFEFLAFEGFNTRYTTEEKNALALTDPFFTVEVKTRKKEADILQFYYKPLGRESHQQLDDFGVQLPFDNERYFGFYNRNHAELLFLQDFVFGKIMKKSSDFFRGQE